MLEKRRLGRTGLEVSLVGFGGIPIMRVSTDEAVRVLGEAFRHGIDFIDTARGYGDSEMKIGAALKAHGTRPVLASKSPKRDGDAMLDDFENGTRPGGWWDPDGSGSTYGTYYAAGETWATNSTKWLTQNAIVQAGTLAVMLQYQWSGWGDTGYIC